MMGGTSLSQIQFGTSTNSMMNVDETSGSPRLANKFGADSGSMSQTSKLGTVNTRMMGGSTTGLSGSVVNFGSGDGMHGMKQW